MPLPEDPSIPAAEGRGRMSKRHCSSPDFTGQGERREGLLVKTQERTPGRGVLLAWLEVYLLHEVCKAWGWGWGPAKQNQSVAPEAGLHELLGKLCTATSGERTWK